MLKQSCSIERRWQQAAGAAAVAAGAAALAVISWRPEAFSSMFSDVEAL